MGKILSNERKKRLNRAFLNVFAVVMTCFPLVTATIWINQVFFWDDRETAKVATVTNPQSVDIFNEPLVSITFDDGWESIYSNGLPILNKYQIPTTQYIITNTFDNETYMSKEQIISLYKSGHEISSHTVSHADLAKTHGSKLSQELSVSKQTLKDLGVLSLTPTFASPYSSISDESLQAIMKQYVAQRNTYAGLADGIDDTDVNVAASFELKQIIGVPISRNTTMAQLKDAIAYTKKHDGWLILTYHQIDSNSTDIYGVTPQVLDQQLGLVADSGIKTATIGVIVKDYLRSQSNASS